MMRSSLRLLCADPSGKVFEHPYLLPTLRTGELLQPAQEGGIPIPANARLVQLPGRLPIGIDPKSGEWELVRGMRAVGALLPPGYTRTALPGEVKAEGPILPQWAYAGAAWSPKGPLVWGLRTDRRTHWDLDRFSTSELPRLVQRRLEASPSNRVLQQL